MPEEEASSRVRWNPEELWALAASMARVLDARPGITLLSALKAAQDEVLPADRRREIKAWSVVQGRLEDLLLQAKGALQQARLAGSNAQTPGAVQEPDAARQGGEGAEIQAHQVDKTAESAAERALDGSAPPARNAGVTGEGGSGGGIEGVKSATGQRPEAQQVQRLEGLNPAELGALFAQALESALVVALQSPAVEDAFAKVVGRAVARAVDERGQEASRQSSEANRGDQRVLLAGFPAQMAKGLEDELRSKFDVRKWSPAQGMQVFETLTKLCNVAVIPEDSDDEIGDVLKGRALTVLRHEGSTARLADRLSTLMG